MDAIWKSIYYNKQRKKPQSEILRLAVDSSLITKHD